MGPGGEAFFTDDEGNLWMAYHAWTGANVGYPEVESAACTLTWSHLKVTNPLQTDQPIPLNYYHNT